MPRLVTTEPTDIVGDPGDPDPRRTTADGSQPDDLGASDTIGCEPADSRGGLPSALPPLANTRWQQLRDKAELMTRWAEACERIVRRSREPRAK